MKTSESFMWLNQRFRHTPDEVGRVIRTDLWGFQPHIMPYKFQHNSVSSSEAKMAQHFATRIVAKPLSPRAPGANWANS